MILYLVPTEFIMNNVTSNLRLMVLQICVNFCSLFEMPEKCVWLSLKPLLFLMMNQNL